MHSVHLALATLLKLALFKNCGAFLNHVEVAFRMLTVKELMQKEGQKMHKSGEIRCQGPVIRETLQRSSDNCYW